MATPDLPEEILVDIFSRLPAKSIGKLRCLSRTWLNLLSTPGFIKSHLAREKTCREYLILIHPSLSIHSIQFIKENDTVSTQLDLPGLWLDVVSCDGLVLLRNNAGEIFLANPITKEHVKIPISPLTLGKSQSFNIFGFGYDSLRDDYKVVTVSYYGDGTNAFVDVYSVKMGVWKRINIRTRSYCSPVISSGVLVSGAIHWLLAKGWVPLSGLVIAAFDLVNEVVFEICAPSGVRVPCKLVFLGGCLCVIDNVSNSNVVDVWVMKEYGVTESWTKFSVCGYYLFDLFKPLCFIGDKEEEVVMVVEGPRLVVYNLKEGMLRDLVVDGVPGVFVDGGTFVESLVSPATVTKGLASRVAQRP